MARIPFYMESKRSKDIASNGRPSSGGRRLFRGETLQLVEPVDHQVDLAENVLALHWPDHQESPVARDIVAARRIRVAFGRNHARRASAHARTRRHGDGDHL